ncbi:helicase, partial [Physocladia obscura]
TLCQNWKKEFSKWLGDERIRVFVIDDKTDIKDFTVGKVFSVLVCGYERLRVCKEAIQNASFDIVVADEGHRLKNKQIQASQIISGLATKKRVILSGTPIQNDLGEFYAMCDLVNPGVLGNSSTFSGVFENPIIASRDPNATKEVTALGLERAQELSRTTKSFILRRTSAVLINTDGGSNLPPKTETTLFIRMTNVQQKLYEHIVGHNLIKRVIGGGGGGTEGTGGKNILGYITMLKKLVNSASLVTDDSAAGSEIGVNEFLSKIRGFASLSPFDLSG